MNVMLVGRPGFQELMARTETWLRMYELSNIKSQDEWPMKEIKKENLITWL